MNYSDSCKLVLRLPETVNDRLPQAQERQMIKGLSRRSVLMNKAALLVCWGVTDSFGQLVVSRTELGREALKSRLPTCMSSVIKHIRNPHLFCKPVSRNITQSLAPAKCHLPWSEAGGSWSCASFSFFPG